MPLKVLNHPPTRPRRAARRERRHQRPEHAIQAAVLRYLTLEPRVAWAHRFNTGAQVIAEPGAKRRFIRYAFPGCADILGQLRDGRLLAIEVKAPGRYPTAEQTAFLARVRRAGGCACLARSVADARAALDAHFAAPAPALALPERGRGRHLVWS